MSLHETINRFLATTEYQRWFRFIQLGLLSIVTTLELVEFSIWNDFIKQTKQEENAFAIPVSYFFDQEMWESIGIKSYYWFLIFATFVFVGVYTAMFNRTWVKKSIKYVLYADVLFILLWFTVSLTNLIPSYGDHDNSSCPRYKYYETDTSLDTLCSAYITSVSLGWAVDVTFVIAAIMSWRLWTNTGEIKAKEIV